MTSGRPVRGPADRGFVLVGVVMFVLALTILGLSLFSLSSFEAQFLGRSGRSVQTLYDAMSGIEWAKVVLAKEKRLQAVQNSEPAVVSRPPRVVYVEAWQGANSSGTINYSSGVPILIRAMADDGTGARRMVEVQYNPLLPSGLYRNLVECHDELVVVDNAGGAYRITELWGPVRVNNNNDTTWETMPGVHPYAGDGVPQPEVTAFINPRWNGASAVSYSTAEHIQFPFFQSIFTLDAGGGSAVRYFKTDATAGQGYTIFDKSADPIINVRGTCVWMVRKGMRFDRPVTVLGNPAEDRLIIVAEPIVSLGPGVSIPRPTGLWFFSGLRTPTNVPVVLVSNSGLAFDRGDIVTAASAAGMISIFGETVHMEGPPQSSGNRQVFRHDQAMDDVIDELAGKNVLPNAPAVSSNFLMVKGTWRELDPDNPS